MRTCDNCLYYDDSENRCMHRERNECGAKHLRWSPIPKNKISPSLQRIMDKIPICPDCHSVMVKTRIEHDDGSGWFSGWGCECKYQPKEARVDEIPQDDRNKIIREIELSEYMLRNNSAGNIERVLVLLNFDLSKPVYVVKVYNKAARLFYQKEEDK